MDAKDYVVKVLRGRSLITAMKLKNDYLGLFYVDKFGNNQYKVTRDAVIPVKDYDMSDVFGI